MNKTAEEATAFLEELIPLVQGHNAYIAAPYTALSALSSYPHPQSIRIGAQNMSRYVEGAYTGEISIRMLQEFNIDFVILGHSERRHLFFESDAVIREKVHLALSEKLLPILCIGETLEERRAGQMDQVLKRQIESALSGVNIGGGKELVLAYEPVWAIGTGEAATPDIAEEAHRHCRKCLAEIVGKNSADSITILYGGSVKASNAQELLEEPNIDGFLVGGASLDPKSFAEIVKS
ncbi:MAG: triose-phosphate isomerase [Simkaniaceae bacterium]|nr:triose-phosphate isomerase [Simkaniaceae bacterium]MCF7851770.1 triose-phosphate isomerase [Simkaniaceae bacterium]